jgi:FlaA1/EpsC-like NDP-sugar epimerase
MSTTVNQPIESGVWWSNLLHRRIQFLADLLVLTVAFATANWLRFDLSFPSDWVHNILGQLPYVVMIQFIALTLSGGRAFIWRYTGITHVRSFLYAAGASFLLVMALRVGLPDTFFQWRVPYSVNIMDTVLAFGGALGLRVMRRSLYERYEKRKRLRGVVSNGIRRPVLLIGAGQAGVLTAKEILGRGDMDLDIRGFVDDDPGKQKRSVLQEIRVLGTTQDLPTLVPRLGIDHVVITMAQASRSDIQRIVEICENVPVKVRIIPGLYEILQGNVEVSRIRDVQIEDLLGREPVELDLESIGAFLAGKTVMVTGSGGSIGSELARQVARFAPAKLLLVERAEFGLFNIDRELRELYPQLAMFSLIADICEEARMRSILVTFQPQVILHAAAHKHVPLMECNAAEAIKNNVIGTNQLGELAGELGVEVFVLISTDKAVSPTSVMGASKRLAELVVQDLNKRFQTRYVAVRFGNVIGSAGSVIPIFQEQIRKGGPVTITDRRMMRYFMTIPEAAQLVLQAGAIGRSGSGGEVFILHMGVQISILELAETIITLSGLRPHEDIKIIETGVRPGEKLYEKLMVEEEDADETSHPKIFINRISNRPAEEVRLAIERLRELSRNGHEEELRAYVNKLLPEARLTQTQVPGNDSDGAETSAATSSVSVGDEPIALGYSVNA